MKRTLLAALLAAVATSAAHAESWIPRSQCLAVAQLAYDAAQYRDDGATIKEVKATVYVGAQNAGMSPRLKDTMVAIVEREFGSHRFDSPDEIGGNVYGACMQMSK